MKHFPISLFSSLQSPFYFYDFSLLKQTLETIKHAAGDDNFHVKYAIKACATEEILQEIFAAGLGADCVSGQEVQAALNAGLKPSKITFAGVAKADWEIQLALQNNIACFNVESVEELKNIDFIAKKLDKKASIAFRVNPNIDALTHSKITTGLHANKFGISENELTHALDTCQQLSNVNFVGLHFHIGSQIRDLKPFEQLCEYASTLVNRLENNGFLVKTLNLGGGLGVNYEDPDSEPIPDFHSYFNIFRSKLRIRQEIERHFELGRSVVAQCGSLIARVLYVKHSEAKKFVMLDAGMTDLIRPALYGALHKIQNLTADISRGDEIYDVVGPICESSDVFAENYSLPETQRGDLVAIRSAGAYGQVMASQYNLRSLPKHIIGRL